MLRLKTGVANSRLAFAELREFDAYAVEIRNMYGGDALHQKFRGAHLHEYFINAAQLPFNDLFGTRNQHFGVAIRRGV